MLYKGRRGYKVYFLVKLFVWYCALPFYFGLLVLTQQNCQASFFKKQNSQLGFLFGTNLSICKHASVGIDILKNNVEFEELVLRN